MPPDRVPDTESSVHPPRGHWLAVARVVWLALFLLNLALFVISLVQQLPTLLHPCTAPTCLLTPVQAASLERMGIGLGAFAAYFAGMFTLVAVAGAFTALLLFLRRRDDWFTLLVGLFLLYPLSTVVATGVSLQGTGLAVLPVLVVTEASYYAVLLLFPDGRFVPRWAWLLLVVWVVWWVANGVADLMNPQSDWLAFYYPIGYLSALAIQIYRYRRTSSARQQQQTKWVVFGFAVALLTNVLYWIIVPLFIVPLALGIPYGALSNTVYYTAGAPIEELAWLALPVSVAIAIQRYQLFDVDALIRRTLVYTTLTAILAAVYFAVIIGTQAAVGAVDRQASHSAIILVGSTLLIAGLFTPLRRGIQSAIDRRFYRSKYDAARTLEAFAGNLRTDLDLSELRVHLLAVVQETMEPESVSLWLFDPSAVHRELPDT
jgi:hypothetical protein